MERPGLPLATLTRRLAEIPPDFLDEIPAGHANFVAALVNDLLARYGGQLPSEKLARFRLTNDSMTINRLALVRIAVWLLADNWFLAANIEAQNILLILDAAAAELATTSSARRFVFDADRREELARVILARLNYRPADETLAQATDRLSGLSSTERRRLVEASRDAERRARAIRAALVKKAAEESADKWTRE